MTSPLALICSVALEAEPVRARMRVREMARIGGREVARGELGGREVLLAAAGMGKVNAAQGLTALLEREGAAGVVGFGVGGAYPGSGLAVGGVALATEEVYGDEGVDTPTGWISTEEIGIPLAEVAGAPRYNRFPLDPARVAAAEASLRTAGLAFVAGPFVTVSACSGTARRGAELAARFGAVCESMEGAACAHVAALYGVPYLEVRGVSNLVEDRDLRGWRLREAADAAARGVEALATRAFDFHSDP